jgi:drug/metabolite transporter (DMT)-like permease
METLFNSSIFFGLSSMFGWGVLNFIVASLSKRVAPFKVAFLVQTLTFFPTLLLLPFFKNELTFGSDFFLLSILGILSFCSYTSLTRGFREGTISVVIPISSTWSIIITILSFIFLKEDVFLSKIFGIILAISGIILVSTNINRILKEKGVKLFAGAKWAFLTSILWGLTFFILAFFSSRIGWYSANLGLRFWSLIVFIVQAALTRRNFSFLLKDVPKLIILVILLDVCTVTIYNIGLVKAEPSIISVIASASQLVTILLSKIILREKLQSMQIIGIALCFVGIVILSLT